MKRRSQRPTLYPYTTLFRSEPAAEGAARQHRHRRGGERLARRGARLPCGGGGEVGEARARDRGEGGVVSRPQRAFSRSRISVSSSSSFDGTGGADCFAFIMKPRNFTMNR